MKNFPTKTTVLRRLFLSLLLGLICLAGSSCSDDEPTSGPQFTIGNTAAKDLYDITFIRRIRLPGEGFEAGDVVQLTDAGLSQHTYTITPELENDALLVALPDFFVDGEYIITIVRGAMKFSYGRATFSSAVELPDREGMNVKGVVCDTNGEPIPDAAVSDGIGIALTDENGHYYLATQRENPHLFVSLPAGYMPQEQEGRFAAFYKSIPKAAAADAAVQVNFFLQPVSNDKFELIVITDTHLTAATAAEAPMYFTTYCIPDINNYIAAVEAAGRPAYLLNLGDLVAANYRNRVTLEDAAQMLKKINCPIFNLAGNHELNDYVLYPDMTSEDAMTEIRRYQATMGPLYYSVNLGRAHLVVLNPNVRVAGSSQMTYSVSEQQLAWLRKDLALVKDKTAPLLVALHTPLFSYNDSTYGQYWLPNGAQVVECLRGFSNIHVFTGHTHRMYNTVSNGITEHNYNCLGGSSGHWTTWRLPSLLADRHQAINTDGSPASYGTLTVDGNSITDYCVKGVNLPRAKRFRAYDRNTIHLTADNYLSASLAQGPRGAAFNAAMGGYADASTENEILVKVWEYNPGWKIEILENNTPLPVTKKQDKDPLYLLCYDIPSYATLDEPGYPATPRTLFSAKAASASSTVTIRVTDSFGQVTEETMERPKAFVSSFD